MDYLISASAGLALGAVFVILIKRVEKRKAKELKLEQELDLQLEKNKS